MRKPSNDDNSQKIINLSWKKTIEHTDPVKRKLAIHSANASERLITFRLFTEESYQQLLIREEQWRAKAEKRALRSQEARLKDGELQFGSGDDEIYPIQNRDLRENAPLKDEYGRPPPQYLGLPLEEIDKGIMANTFVVLSKRFGKINISRFSASSSLYLFSPWNPVRRVAVYIATSQYFDSFILLTILVNCVCLAIKSLSEIEELETTFFIIYTLEVIIKVLAKGVILDKYTYLRDPWNWLDLLIVISGIVSMRQNEISSSPQALRTFRVLRVLKTLSFFHGLRTFVNAMLRAFKMLCEVILLTFFCLMVLAVFSVELFSGSMRQKCVRDPATLEKPPNLIYAEFYKQQIRNESNWQRDSQGEYKLCGNSTGAGNCAKNFTCLPDIGENPDYGYTNFDNFGWGMLLCFQVTTLDFWENTFRKVLVTNGAVAVVYFIVTVFFGSFYLLNLMLAVVTISYEEEAIKTEMALTDEQASTSRKQKNDFLDLVFVTLLNTKYGGPIAKLFRGPSIKWNQDEKHDHVRDKIRRWRSKSKKKYEDEDLTFGRLKSLSAKLKNMKKQMEIRKYAYIWSSNVSVKRRHSLPERDKEMLTGLRSKISTSDENLSRSDLRLRDKSQHSQQEDKISRSSNCSTSLYSSNELGNINNHKISRSSNCSIPLYSSNDLGNMNNHKIREGFPPTSQAEHLIIEDFKVDHMSYPHSGPAIGSVPGHPTEKRGVAIMQEHLMCTNNAYSEPALIHRNTELVSHISESKKQESNSLPVSRLSGRLTPTTMNSSWSVNMKDNSDIRPFNANDSTPFTIPTSVIRTGGGHFDTVLEVFDDSASDSFVRSSLVVPNLLIDAVEDHNFICHENDEIRQNITEWNVTPSRDEENMFARILEKNQKINEKYVIGLSEDECDSVEIQEDLDNVSGCTDCTWKEIYSEDFANTNKNALPPLFDDDDVHGTVSGTCFVQDSYENKNVSSHIQNPRKVTHRIDNVKFISSLHLDQEFSDISESHLIEMDPETDTSVWSIYSVRRTCFYWRRTLRIITSGRPFNLLINLAIILNTIFMSLEHHGMPELMREVLRYANLVFTMLFVVEAILKLTGMGLKRYFKGIWNRFDMVIALIGIANVILERFHIKSSSLLILRTVRLLRILKLARIWPAMNNLLTVIVNAMVAVGHLTIILIIILYMFAVIGLERFSKIYTEKYFNGEEVPRWNFTTFPHSFMMVFRILCGEWVEALWDCMRINTQYQMCMVVFLPTLLLGNFVVLNLFLALLLNAFGKETANKKKQSDTKIVKIICQRVKGLMQSVCCKRKNVQVTIHIPKEQRKHSTIHGASESSGKKSAFERRVMALSVTGQNVDVRMLDKDKNKDISCLPSFLQCCFAFVLKIWKRIQCYALRVVNSYIFNTFIFILILSSSIELVFEDYYLTSKEELKKDLDVLNKIFTVLFVLEMILYWVAKGFVYYFTNIWTLLDFIAVAASVLSTLLSNIDSDSNDSPEKFHAFRALRALRPLRTISRCEGMKIVINALIRAIPEIINVFLVSMVFWLIFSVVGVQFLSGKFHKCVNGEGKKISHHTVADRNACRQQGYQWINSKVNFDNVLNGFLALFQVATFEGWMEVMEDAVDSSEVDKQPEFERSMVMYIYFVAFIICGSFLTLNLVIGVIIDNFSILKKKYEGSVMDIFLSTNQQNYYKTLKLLVNRQPEKSIKRPRFYVQQFFYDMSVSKSFELLLMAVAFLNLCTMAFNYYRIECLAETILDILNIAFITFFALEAVIKIIGLRMSYFKDSWCLFNFFVVIISVLELFGFILKSSANPSYRWIHNIFNSPTILRVFRIARIGRVLRLIKVAKGINKLILALIISLPAILNIMALLLLFMFMYAVIGMLLFDNLKLTGAFTDMMNFRTFWSSMMILLTLATAAGWNDVLESMFDIPNCNRTHFINSKGIAIRAENGDCGTRWIATTYMVSYIIITNLLIINMYIAIILENYDQAHRQEEIGVTQGDLDMFYSVWQRYDPKATQFIKYTQLSDLVADLDKPFGLDKPNEIALVSFNIPIKFGNKIHCLDILLALLKNVLSNMEDSNDMAPIRDQMAPKFAQMFPKRLRITQISTTLLRKKEDVAARTLQKAWLCFKTKQAMKTLMLLAVRENVRRTSSLSLVPSIRSVGDLCINLTVALHRHFQYLLSIAEERGHLGSSTSNCGSIASVVRRVSVSSGSDPTSRLVKDDDRKQNNVYLKPEDPFLSTSRSLRSTAHQTTSPTKIVITPDQ